MFATCRGTLKGGYILLKDTDGTPDVILIGTGSEVQFCLEAAEQLAAKVSKARVVSMPCWKLFRRASRADYRESVLPAAVTKRVAVEAGIKMGWEKYLAAGAFIGMESFGASAPAEELYEHFGITSEAIVAKVRTL